MPRTPIGNVTNIVTIAAMRDGIAGEQSNKTWLAIPGFVVGVPCGIGAALGIIYVLGLPFGDHIPTASIGGAVILSGLLVTILAAVFFSVRLGRAGQSFLAGLLAGFACGVALMTLIGALLGSNTGHGVVS